MDCCNPSGKSPNVGKGGSLPQSVTIDGPVEIGNFPDQIDVVKSHYCDADTGTHFECIKIYINGVLDSETNTDTGISCEDPIPQTPDVEKIQYCNKDTGTLWVKVCQYVTTYTDDGEVDEITETILSETDLEIDCEATHFEMVRECRDGVINIVTYSIDADGVPTETDAIVTEEICAPIDKQDVTVKDCDDNDINVQVDQVVKVEGTISAKLCPEDVITVDVEYVCNEDTNLYDEIVITSTNGVPAAPVITPTNISCENIDTSKDYEQVRVCDATTGTVHIITTAFTQDDVATQIGDLDTLEVCTPPEKQKVEVDTCDGTDSALVDYEVSIKGVPTVKLCPEDVITVDFEYVCNEDTNVYDEIVITSTNGVPDAPVITPTNISCENVDTSRDFEESRVCDPDTGTIHIITTVYFQDDTSRAIGDIDTLQPCCEGTPECVESQEWTYGLDNTGTNFADTATYVMTLSDGSTLSIEQTPTSGWTAQNQLLTTLWQAEADAAGLDWFIEPRAVNNAIPSDISGGYGVNSTPTGLPGAPSVVVAEYLVANGMVARYLNIQICPGNPVPVDVTRTESALLSVPYSLTTAGALLGPKQKFTVCQCCGEEPVWYLEDGITLADAGQIPNCYEPCGTLALTSAPPDRSCEFFFDIACDNVGEPDVDTNWVNLITRRATVCNGEQISVDYFTEDPNDPSALIDYTLIGDFVDCDTGEPIELPVPECSEFEIVKLYSLETNGEEGFRNREWHDTEQAISPFPTTAEPGRNFRENHDFSLPTTVDNIQNNFILNDTDNTALELDIQVKDGYVIAREGMLLRYGGSSEGYWAVELGECCGDLELLNESGGFSPTRTMEFTIPKGIHQLRLWNIDSGGSNSSANLSYSLDGGITWIVDNTPPNLQIYTGKPNEVCENIKVCEDTGAFIGLLDGQVKDPADYYECPLSCTASGGGSGESCSDNDLELTIQTGANSNIPAGAKSVTINNITGITTINGGFELGNGRRVDSISFGTDRGNCINEVLPAYTMSGGTWQWIATF